MADDDNGNRPFWKTRRVWGAATAAIGGILLMVPATAPVAVVVGTLPVTWPMIGTALTHIGGLVFGYGIGAKVEREKTESKK